MKEPIIHGENVLLPIEKMPEGKVEKYNTFIVGHSETGHHHILEAAKGTEFDIIVSGNDIFFTTTGASKIVHKKSNDIHKTVDVKPGTYKVNRKTEYDPFQKALRQVWD